MLTGEYDWSNTPELAQKTADKIPGAKHKAMPGLGHFPATENPKAFVPHLIEAIEHIQQVRSEGLSTMRLGNGTD
jgi:pimeloyl-ACP methyl ester carboxylesterase